MKEKQTVPEKTIVIDIKLTRRVVAVLACVLVIVGLFVYLTLMGERAAASEAETAQTASTGMRQFYLSQSAYTGTLALTACAPGYHMASLWEIADPSNLKYNTSLGRTAGDSGQGPPSWVGGWVRTGYTSGTSTTPGRANCDGWTTNSIDIRGTEARLPDDWTAGEQNMGGWATRLAGCNGLHLVWCIED